jgi:mRNA-degrading endonuclease RelE of RelBE toxin-antitoxin system
MDAIQKALKKLSAKERGWVRDILAQLMAGKLQGLDIKKLQGRDDIFRVRKGNMRIVYRKSSEDILILLIERRNERTYDL